MVQNPEGKRGAVPGHQGRHRRTSPGKQVLTRPEEFRCHRHPNLHGDTLSDALAAQVGGIGIAPGGNINYITGHAVSKPTHGTAPKYANQTVVNPGSVILSGVMMFRHIWAGRTWPS